MQATDNKSRDVVQDMISSLTLDQYGAVTGRNRSSSGTSSRLPSSTSPTSGDERGGRRSFAHVLDDPPTSVLSVLDAIQSDLDRPSDLLTDGVLASASATVQTPAVAQRPPTSESQVGATMSAAPVLNRSHDDRPFRSTPFPVASKERDDGGSSRRHDRHTYTPQSLSRMLASGLTHSPVESRSTSYSHCNVNLSSIPVATENNSLHQHIYIRGLLAGKHSDISILAFQHRYKLHRLVLDRAPFFTTALSGPWLESSAHEIELYPEDTDQNITQAAFELALKHLYGCDITAEADAEAVALFATGCWLDLPDLIGASITSILKQMHSDMLSPLINILNDHYYGRYGERIMESAKAMLCRDGWEMPLKHWDGIPGDIVCEIIGGDGFYVQGEWERWVLAKRLLDRRLRQQAVELGLLDLKASIPIQAPKFLIDRSVKNGKKRELSDEDAVWLELYTHSDVTTLLSLLQTGIHYIHLDFEQLQYIRGACDTFELPVLPDTTISDALWMQMELRQRVVNAKDADLELGLGFMTSATPARHDRDHSSTSKVSETAAQHRGAVEESAVLSAMHRSSQKSTQPSFVVPTSDCNIVWGADDISTLTSHSRQHRHTASHHTTTSKPIDTPLPPDPRRFFAYPSEINDSSWQTPADMRTATGSPTAPILRTSYPPFRFAVEFPNPRVLKERKRVYSRTIFYAGSLWNIYIQKVRSQKSPQLGVYLHRARERGQPENPQGPIGGGISAAYPANSSVDERITNLERDMTSRGRDRGSNLGARRTFIRQRSLVRRYGHYIPPTASNAGAIDPNITPEQDADSLRSTNTRRTMGRPITSYPDGQIESYITLDSDSDDEDYMYDGEASWANWSALRSNLSPSRHLPNSHVGWPMRGASVQGAHEQAVQSAVESSPLESSSSASAIPAPNATSNSTVHQTSHARRNAPTLPPYSDPRPTIKTYFKIYVPSKGGRMLSVYESAPDKFDFSQSWGWRSGSLMLDEGVECPSVNEGHSGVAGQGTATFEGMAVGEDSADGGSGSTTKGMAAEDRDSRWRRRGEGSLRFMIVIGNL